MKREFTTTEIQMLIDRYPHERTDKLASEMGGNKLSVYQKAYALGLKKTPEFLASPDSGIMTKGDTRGLATRFKKGDIPKNKGQKMSKDIYDKCKATMFKKGDKPKNTKTDGYVSIRRDTSGRRYLYIRVSEGKWELYHRTIWEQHYGKIPDGFNVVFKDGNTANIAVDNLELISNEELMNRNTIHRFPADLKSAIRALKKLKKQING